MWFHSLTIKIFSLKIPVIFMKPAMGLFSSSPLYSGTHQSAWYITGTWYIIMCWINWFLVMLPHSSWMQNCICPFSTFWKVYLHVLLSPLTPDTFSGPSWEYVCWSLPRRQPECSLFLMEKCRELYRWRAHSLLSQPLLLLLLVWKLNLLFSSHFKILPIFCYNILNSINVIIT